MEIAVPARRSPNSTTIVAVIGLAFCFFVGLAAGTAYRLWPAGTVPPAADDASAPAPAPIPLAAAAPAPARATATAARQSEIASPAEIAPPAVIIAAPASPPVSATSPAAPPTAPRAAVASTPAPAMTAATPPAPQPAAAPAPKSAPHPAAAHAAAPLKKPHLAAKPARHPAPAPVAATSAATPAPAAALAHRAGPFRIQFGAFASEANARRVQWAVEATGLKLDVTQAPGAGGHTLFVLRSADYPDYATARDAAQNVREHVTHFAHPVAIDYAIEADRSDTVQVQAAAQ